MEFAFHNEASPPPRSTFVNTLAWIFIVLGGFATFISILQNIMIQTMFPKEQMDQAMQQAEGAGQPARDASISSIGWSTRFSMILAQ